MNFPSILPIYFGLYLMLSQRVMKNLVKRYLKNSKRGEQEKGVTEDDLNEIKQDISAFRYEMLEILKNKPPVPAAAAAASTGTKAVKFHSDSGIDNANHKPKTPPEKEDSLHRVPSYLFRKGKKGKKNNTSIDQPSIKRIKIAPIQEEDYSMPDFLKVKTVKNVVIAVNELQKKSMRRKLSQAILNEERRLSAASLASGAMSEESMAWRKTTLSDSGISESMDEPPLQRGLDTVDEDSQDDDGEEDDSDGQENDDYDANTESSSRRSSIAGRAPLRREKAFASRLEEDLTSARNAGADASSPDGSGDSQSTSGILSTNNSFQSQDSGEEEDDDDDENENDDDDNEDDEDAPEETLRSPEDGFNSGEDDIEELEGTASARRASSPAVESGDDVARTTDIPQLNWQAKRPSNTWDEGKATGDELEMSHYVYNGYNNVQH